MRKIHLIGICGKGMSAVAKLLLDLGYVITGSDEGFYPPVSTYIEQNKIPFVKGYKKENIAKYVDTVIISKHAKLVPEENEEVKYAFELKEQGKLDIKSFPEVLKEITKERENIVVAGSFGKSTCTALLSHVLEVNSLDIGYFIGATPITPKLNAHIGKHKNFVLEGDEYPSANWDKTSKFMYYNAHDLLLTALAHDHINIFKTHAEFKQPFFNLIQSLPASGILVYNLDELSLVQEEKKILELHKNSISYSVSKENANYYASNINYGEVTSFEVFKNNISLGSLQTKLLGQHNIQNILGVTAFILEKGLLTFEEIKSGVAGFEAVEGRLNQIPTRTGFKIYEGFGSSVDKAISAIDALAKHYPMKKIKIIFEPHTFSWRNKEALYWYDTVFQKSSLVYIYEPPAHGSHTINQLSQQEIIDRVKLSGVNAEAIGSTESDVIKIIKDTDTQNDIILTLTSGDLGNLPKMVAEKI